MNRFEEEPQPANHYMRHLLGDDDASFSCAVNICQNCGEAVERLTLVPEFDYMGCDDCMEEALRVIAREAAEKAALPKYEPMQASLFPRTEVA